MTPDQVLFIVRAAVQVGSAVDQAWQQKLRDEDLLIGNIDAPRANLWEQIDELFRSDLADRVKAGGDLAQHWDPAVAGGKGGCKNSDAARDALLGAARECWAEQGPSSAAAASGQTYDGLSLLKQWKDGEGPPAPYVRIVVALASVAADYAKVNPGVFRAGSKAEPLILAIAEAIPRLLPDPDDRQDVAQWNRHSFAERALTTFLHAGLSLLQEHPDQFTGEEALQALLSASLKPMLDLFDAAQDAGTKLDLAKLQETLVGPVAKAALRTIAERQAAFLGDDLAASTAAGALVGSVLGLWQNEGLENAFSSAGFQKLAVAALDVAVSRPALFVGRGQKAKDDLARDLLAGVAGAIKQRAAAGGVGRDFLVEIGIEALGAVGSHAENFVDKSKPWDQVAASALAQVADGLAAALKTQGAARLEDVFSRERAIALGRLVLQQAAATPGMLVKDGTEIRQLVAALASAMAADDNLLLGQGEWNLIVGAAVEEAAKNPERLFKLDGTKPEDQLGTRLISLVLKAAAADFRQHGRQAGVVAGEVLAEAVAQTLRAAIGNLQGAAKAAASQAAGTDPISLLVAGLNEFSRDNRDSFGWREWRWVFRNLVVEAIDQGPAFVLSPARIRKLLESEPEAST